ncbi:MAG: hypothetical protein LBN29_11335 [Mediterranea sp.]|jgi:hypothetical protein|nr:hypothetical protein [Mediterranea sp.]
MKRDKEIEFPDRWEEVSPAEWVYLLKLREALIVKPGVTLLDVKRAWCDFALRRRGLKGADRRAYLLLVDRLATGHLDWMWRVGDGGVELAFDSTANPLPRWRGLVGPRDHGEDLTFGEFRHASALMNAYTASGETAHLLAFCGTLYRPAGKRVGCADFDGHWREPFHPSRLELYVSRASAIPPHVAWGIYAWFGAFCRHLLEGAFVIGGKEVSFAPLFTRRDRGDGGANDLGLESVRFSVAESGIFGDAAKTDDTPLLTVLMKLLDDKWHADALLERMSRK